MKDQSYNDVIYLSCLKCTALRWRGAQRQYLSHVKMIYLHVCMSTDLTPDNSTEPQTPFVMWQLIIDFDPHYAAAAALNTEFHQPTTEFTRSKILNVCR